MFQRNYAKIYRVNSFIFIVASRDAAIIMHKEKLDIGIGPTETSHSLRAIDFLSSLTEKASYHRERDIRHPLGVYCLSISRICEKVIKCADRLDKYWVHDSQDEDLRSEIIDYLELALYAAAEHTDDIKTVAHTFFKTEVEAKEDRDVRMLLNSVKPLRKEIAAFTNAIKHSHGRIRLFDTDFNHDGRVLTLLGFFIEGFKDGQASPNPIFARGW